ncbi:hypothetical protein [Slackia heliotrinireducens]|uniref:hypothetical protein n=1 Tax=Slackia heliotrinireducens TaxID=84110 RepID=UPI003315BE10
MRVDDLRHIRQALDTADLVLIGASNGLDMAEGLNIFAPDAHFAEAYGDLAQACGARSVLEGMFRSRGNLAQAWAWQARFACREWLDYELGAVMGPLRKLVGQTDHFVLTCNMDARFMRAGFDEAFVMQTEGTVARMVCSASCCDERHASAEAVRALDASIVKGAVDLRLIPACPHCGAPLTLAVDEMRLQHPDAEIAGQVDVLRNLHARHRGGNIVVLELGVGMRNGIIKQLLAQAAAGEPNLTYAIFNYNQVVFPQGLEARCVGVDGDMAQAFETMARL